MQKLTVTICAFATMITAAYGGTATYSGKEMKQVEQVPPCPEWYRDTEWNVSLWGTYVFTANNWEDDRYFQSDHAWGGASTSNISFIAILASAWKVGRRNRPGSGLTDSTLLGSQFSARMSALSVPSRER